MKLTHINIAGFRGFREEARFPLSESFNIICGRNGVGKSTVFDAFEYAVTGAIDKYTGLGAAKDRPTDYIWWRGDGVPARYQVSVGFLDASGNPTEIMRSRDTGSQQSGDDIEKLLCEQNKPDRALYQLCRTSIIRDELIAALSVDLSENDRFDLVRNALGEIEANQHVAKARKVVLSAESRVKKAEAQYESARQDLNRVLSELSIAQAELSAGRDVEAALQLIRSHVTRPDANIPELLSEARKSIAAIRETSGALGEGLHQLEEIHAIRQEISEPKYQAKRAELQAHFNKSIELVAEAERRLSDAKAFLQKEQDADAMATALSVLITSGEHIGLHDDHCPLCNAVRTQTEYAAGIAVAKARLQATESGVAEAQKTVLQLELEYKDTVQQHSTAMSERDSWIFQETTLGAREEANVEYFSQHNLNHALINDLVALQKELSRQHDEWLNLTHAISAVESSGAADRVANIQLRVSTLQSDVELSAKEMERAERVVAETKSLERAVKRSGDEIIDERLAVISPLLGEIYQRLRPHAKWRSIEYSIRGDVRRFLSLRVGQGLNPQFLFSSGQRRAAGIAFLLSVYLCRPWCKLDTLFLDDPIQHIDDFRAFHLVEVIAALRRTGRQIICAVEDSDLADLMCRRLTSESNSPGARFDIDAAGSVVRQEIPVLPRSVLKSAQLQVS